MIISIRILSAWAFSLVMFSMCALAQETRLPAFDSFSYLQDPMFNARPIVAPALPEEPLECAAVESDAEPQPQVEPEVDIIECPDIADELALKQSERFELQLALDKALSQILKLTVDYEALYTRVQTMATAAGEKPGKRSLSARQSQQSQEDLQALMQLNAKRLADRDQQLLVLQNRLKAVQARYDNENVSRLLAEKQLKVAMSRDKTAKIRVTESNKKTHLLAEQLEQNQVALRQLKIDLTAVLLQNAKLTAEQNQSPEVPQQASESAQSPVRFQKAQEWVVEGLEFMEGSADIKLDSVQNLSALVQHLKQNTSLTIQINGYTDSVGSANFNLRLSQARADSVAEYLIGHGIEFYRVKALGYGERRPVADNENEQGRLQNRRVAVIFLE